jgi:3-oxoacyl-[acyl-carrier protein] reductase
VDGGFRGKRVLVTGGTRGVGKATTLALARAGAEVITCHHTDGEAGQNLARQLKELGGRHKVVRADVTDPDDVARLVEECQATVDGLDAVVNNVGVDGQVVFADLAEQEWRRLLDANLTSAYLVTRAALDLLADGGSIVMVGASVAMRGRFAGVHYTASKSALIGLARSLAKELGPRGIRVNVVAPGLVEGEQGTGLPPEVTARIVGLTALGRICTVDDVAGAVLFLTGDTSRYVTGATLNVDGGV